MTLVNRITGILHVLKNLSTLNFRDTKTNQRRSVDLHRFESTQKLRATEMLSQTLFAGGMAITTYAAITGIDVSSYGVEWSRHANDATIIANVGLSAMLGGALIRSGIVATEDSYPVQPSMAPPPARNFLEETRQYVQETVTVDALSRSLRALGFDNNSSQAINLREQALQQLKSNQYPDLAALISQHTGILYGKASEVVKRHAHKIAIDVVDELSSELKSFMNARTLQDIMTTTEVAGSPSRVLIGLCDHSRRYTDLKSFVDAEFVEVTTDWDDFYQTIRTKAPEVAIFYKACDTNPYDETESLEKVPIVITMAAENPPEPLVVDARQAIGRYDGIHPVRHLRLFLPVQERIREPASWDEGPFGTDYNFTDLILLAKAAKLGKVLKYNIGMECLESPLLQIFTPYGFEASSEGPV